MNREERVLMARKRLSIDALLVELRKVKLAVETGTSGPALGAVLARVEKSFNAMHETIMGEESDGT